MNKLLIATAAVALATAGTAGAADLPTKAPPMVAPAPVQSWTGCWVSGGVGYGMYDQEHFAETNPGLVQLEASSNSGGKGWLGRVGVGCDYQFNHSFLIGAFGDYDWMSIKGTWADPLPLGVVGEEKEKHAWAAGARLGYLPYDNLLTFVSGGYTQAKFGEIDFIGSTFPSVAFNQGILENTYHGWFIGGGYEYRLPWWQGLTWKTEYRFNTYSSADLAEVNLLTGTPNGTADNMKKWTQTVTTSLVWRFNFWGGGPVVARY
jgi:outer membrane immunogenic protein